MAKREQQQPAKTGGPVHPAGERATCQTLSAREPSLYVRI